MRKRILVTGGCGFIGHHMVEYLLENDDCDVVILDRLDVSGNLNRLTELPNWEKNKNRVTFVWHDMKSEFHNNEILKNTIGEINVVLHLGASSHVDRSIDDPMLFVMDNVVGTCNILNFARQQKNLNNFVYFSTDEVFGPAPEGVNYKENDRYNSHANKSLDKAGSRYYIHAKNVCNAVDFLLKNGKHGEKYNIVGEKEVDNLSLAKLISKFVGKDTTYNMVDFHSSRPGHDLRYGLDGSKMKEMGWTPINNLEKSLKNLVEWSIKNPKWIGL